MERTDAVMTEDQVVRYTELTARRMEIVMHSGASWRPEYAQELEEIDAELAALRQHVDAATDAQPASKVVANTYCGSCQYHLERLDCDPDCDLDRQQLKDEVRQAYLNGGRTGYLYDIDGNEYYTTRDGIRHYTRAEG